MESKTTKYNDTEKVNLYAVEIEGRGGDSVYTAHFETEEGAIFASALDGKNYVPVKVRALKLSDGTYIEIPNPIRVQTPPSEAEIAKLGLPEQHLTPAQKILLARRSK